MNNNGEEILNKDTDTIVYATITGQEVAVGYCGMTSGDVIKQLKKSLPKFIKKQLDSVESDYNKELIKQMAIDKAKSILEDNKNGRE